MAVINNQPDLANSSIAAVIIQGVAGEDDYDEQDNGGDIDTIYRLDKPPDISHRRFDQAVQYTVKRLYERLVGVDNFETYQPAYDDIYKQHPPVEIQH